MTYLFTKEEVVILEPAFQVLKKFNDAKSWREGKGGNI